MATTRLMPLHTGKGRSVAQALGRTAAYVENPDKTGGGEWITAYECDPAIVDQEFLFSKRQYAALTGREKRDNDVIAYHLRQSFKPGEIDPATANQIGYDLALSLTKGSHAFLVCTHVDRAHVHSHIIFNSTSLDCSRKFRNFWRSSFAVRRLSDLLCLENGLSVIENPKPSRGSYGTWLGDTKPPTVRARLEQLIDDALVTGPKDFDCFLAAMKGLGAQVKRGKHLAFQIPGGKRFIRCDSLGADYSEASICERIAGVRTAPKKQKVTAPPAPQKPNLLIDIQAKLQQTHSPGFERWAKLFNLKEMAKTLLYMQESGLKDYDALTQACDVAGARFDGLTERTKVNDRRMKEIAELQKYVGAYGKTREIYAQYRKLPPKKAARFMDDTRRELFVVLYCVP